MNKIKLETNKETSFVYHMLSVSKCGYDNDYGRKYRKIHDEKDLDILSKNRNLITVNGGEHCGDLYWLMVSLPARGDVPAAEFYGALYRLFASGEHADFLPGREWLFEDYKKYSEEIKGISSAMMRNYKIFEDRVWEQSQEEIDGYIEPINLTFEKSDFTDKAEKLTGETFKYEHFHAVMVNSMEDGPEAVDISESQDVFGIARSEKDSFYFIAHEFVIYLLKSALKDTSAFKDISKWNITEGLAEFYLRQIMCETEIFSQHDDAVKYYEEEKRKNPDLTAKELFRLAETDM